MRYNTEAQRPSFVLPPGEYPAMVESAEEKTSKAGNPMLVVELNVYKIDGNTVTVKDYMITGGQYSADWKIKNLCKSAGIEVTGTLNASDLVGRGLRVKLGIKPAEGKYSEQNKVNDYLVSTEENQTQPNSVSASAKAYYQEKEKVEQNKNNDDGDAPF
jgi:hypothetical protein